jgi:outer membrane biosynthesis protein TonB
MAILDHEALAAVRRAVPFPFVEGAIVVPIVFDLKAPPSGIVPGGR